MKKALLLAVLAAFSTLLFSQQIYRVISENGLKLRNAPSKTGKVLAVAPFLSEVEVLAKYDLDYDGKGEYFDDENPRDSLGIAYITYQDTFYQIGRWLPVKYAELKGFMFSGFLFKHQKPDYEIEISSDYLLRSNWGSIWTSNNFEIERDWNWFGLFKLKNSYEIRSVERRFWVDDIDLKILTTDEIQPLLIFGTMKKWPNRVIKDGLYMANPTELQDEIAFQAFRRRMKTRGIQVEKEQKSEEFEHWLEVIPAYFFRPKHHDTSYKFLMWEGDLDGDGKTDFILDNEDPGGSADLFLSSEAKNGEAVRLVACIFYWGC